MSLLFNMLSRFVSLQESVLKMSNLCEYIVWPNPYFPLLPCRPVRHHQGIKEVEKKLVAAEALKSVHSDIGPELN